jgi:hypothetical protein
MRKVKTGISFHTRNSLWRCDIKSLKARYTYPRVKRWRGSFVPRSGASFKDRIFVDSFGNFWRRFDYYSNNQLLNKLKG